MKAFRYCKSRARGVSRKFSREGFLYGRENLGGLWDFLAHFP